MFRHASTQAVAETRETLLKGRKPEAKSDRMNGHHAARSSDVSPRLSGVLRDERAFSYETFEGTPLYMRVVLSLVPLNRCKAVSMPQVQTNDANDSTAYSQAAQSAGQA